MIDAAAKPSLLIISQDRVMVDKLISNTSDQQNFKTVESAQQVIEDPALLAGNSIVIFDISANGNNFNASIDQMIKIKKADPAQTIILVGEQDLLAEALKSNVQPLVYRAFPKPVRANQVALAFNSGHTLHAKLVAMQAAGEDITMVGPAENKTDVAALANARSSSSVIFAALGLIAISVAGWLIFVGSGNDEPIATSEPSSVTSIELEDPVITVSATEQRINQFNQEAAIAMEENRIISPAGDNALEYYEQVLSLDAYDTTAYQGKKEIAGRLRTSYNELAANAEFGRALQIVEILQRIDPLNLSNDQLHNDLQVSINSHVKEIRRSGTSQQIADTAAVLKELESKFEGSKSASNALKAEQQMVARIDAALKDEILIPPALNNAYALVSEALKANSVSTVNITPRVKSLSKRLLRLAQTSLEQDDFEMLDKLGGLVEKLSVNPTELASLNEQVKQRKEALIAAEEAKLAAEMGAGNDTKVEGDTTQTDLDLPKITPAKIIKRDPPRYPSRALSRDIEGWVAIEFRVNAKGEPFNIQVASAEPEGMFEKSAMRAVKKWRFTPALNETSGLPVESAPISTKLQFKLD